MEPAVPAIHPASKLAGILAKGVKQTILTILLDHQGKANQIQPQLLHHLINRALLLRALDAGRDRIPQPTGEQLCEHPEPLPGSDRAG